MRGNRSFSRATIVFALLATILPVFFAAPAASAATCEKMVFGGPWVFVRQAGPPQIKEVSFSLQFPNNNYILHIINGNEDGSNRVRSGWIWFNDTQLVKPSDFNPHIGVIERIVSANTNNTLKVKLASTPGSFITIYLYGDDIIAPIVTITEPQEGCVFETNTIDVKGTVNDPSAQITVNGQPATVNGLQFTAVNVPLVSGPNTITAHATLGGQTADDSIIVTYSAPFNVLITSPQNGVTLNTTPITVSGTVDTDNATVKVNDVYAIVTDHTFIAANVWVNRGQNTITAFGFSTQGSATDSITVTLEVPYEPQPEGSFGEQYEDLVPPNAAIESYDSKRFSVITGLVHNLSDLPIENVSVSILNHPEYGIVSTDAEGRFSIPVEGGGIITVVYRKSGLISAQRQVSVPWNDSVVSETIQMIPEDTQSSTFIFDGNPENVITHQSTEVTDEWGTRSCTMVLTGDNQAYEVDKDGNVIRELSTITVRATEFPTPESMPAILPPNSGFTFCADMSVDGIERITFDQPIITWVNNFLEFPVGEPVPVGYYDVARGVWVPSESGKVVKLLDTNSDGTVDALDATGDDLPDDLNNNSSFNDEVLGLDDSQKYPPEATFWRFPVPHFYSKWDANWSWAFGPGSDAVFPTFKAFPEWLKCPSDEDCFDQLNSSISHRTRIFQEDIPIPGTDFTLHYASNRARGYRHLITVPASGDTVPASLKRIITQLTVAGRSFQQILDPLPNQKAEFEWDGLDHRGNPVKTAINAHIEIGFVYDGVYQRTTRFGYNGNGMITGSRTRQEVTLWRRGSITVHPENQNMPEGRSVFAGIWTLSAQHFLSPADCSILYKGDGNTIQNTINLVNTIAGTGLAGYSGDGGSALNAQLNSPRAVAVDKAGTIYFTDRFNNRIRKVDTSGIITTVVGTGVAGFSGDGGPAIQAQINNPGDICTDSMGNFYFSDRLNHRIRKVDTNGIITTVAGNGIAGTSGDDGPATEAQLNTPHAVSVDANNNLYLGFFEDHRIRRVDTSGIITTVAGNGIAGYSGDGGPATQARLNRPGHVAFDTAGNFYIIDSYNCRVRRVDNRGIITTVVGTGVAGYSGDGGPATAAQIDRSYSIAIDARENLFIADRNNNCVRKVNAQGIISTVAGNGLAGFSGDGAPAVEATFDYLAGVAVDPQGALYIADADNNRIRKVALADTFADHSIEGDIPFADENGLGYIMASSGRHKNTIDLATGKTLYTFGYDTDNNLISITDQFNNQTTIQRNASGVPTAIVSPDGLTTTLTIDANNHLTRITFSDTGHYDFEYTAEGLLTAKTDPKGNRFEYTYNAQGRIIEAADQEGGLWQYFRTTYPNGDILTQVLTGEGNQTAYQDSTDNAGAYTSTIIDSTGAETLFSQSADGLTVAKSLPCGMTLNFTYDLDPEYKFKVVKEMTETTPASLVKTTLSNKTYQDTNADEIKDLITETISINNKTTTLVQNTLQHQKTITSPMGRTITTLYDPNTLLTQSVSIPGFYATAFGYDSKGRLTSTTTDTRQSTFAYNSQGFLASITDPANQTTTYDYDAVGRVIAIHRPDTSSVGFTYDQNGNMTVLTNPATINHGFSYNTVNLNSSYTAPLSGSYSYIYDKDRRLKETNFPSGRQIKNIYDTIRLAQIQTPEGNIDFTYLCSTKIGSIAKGTEAISYGYDGSLVTSETQTGTLNQLLNYTYNNEFNPSSFTYAGATENYVYDNDGLLTGAGPFTIGRNANNGLPVSVAGGALSLARTFNGYGEVSGETTTVNGMGQGAWGLTRDNTGRITDKAETVNGVTANYHYTYDPMGRLLTVTKDSVLVEQYQYDEVGTRTYEMNSLRGIAGRNFTYSDEDHLLTAGSTTYQYDLDGFLTTKTQGTNVTHYSYSSRGELLSFTFPNGAVIEYLHDPIGRRIAKKVNGVITEKYLWHGLTRLLAVYDGSNNLLMRFQFADSRMPFALTTATDTYYLMYDQVGSLRVISDASGNAVKKLDYDSFGNIIGDSNPGFAVPFGFAGGLRDVNTGLVRFGFRDYDPDIGRWTAKDPIGFKGGDVDLFGYCLSDPINCVDSYGLWKGVDHNSLTNDAMKGQFNRYDINAVISSNVSTDILQLDKYHYMPGHEEESEKLKNDYLNKAVELERSGHHWDAMDALGTGLHILQDRYAHSEQNCGWEAHLKGNCDNPEKTPCEFAKAREASKRYIEQFLERSRRR